MSQEPDGSSYLLTKDELKMATEGTIRDDRFVEIVLDRSKKTIRSKWKGYVPSDQYRGILLQIHQLIAENGVRSWLSDSRKMGAILHEDTVWSLSDLAPRFEATELDKLAIINSADIIHQMAASRMVEETAPKVPYEMAFFDDESEAIAWLSKGRKAVG